MRKLRLTFTVSATLTVLAALAFFNNIVAIVRWWRAFLAAGGDTTGVPAHAPGCFAWLDWTAVDYSAVTTFIPLLGFICLARGSWRMLKKRVIDGADDFPFFRGSDQLNVALGLFGTLWGIIVIGYFKLDTVTMADLMQCLHTALFSTLMAVVWVFLIDRPLIRPFFQRLLAESGLARVEEGDLTGAMDRFIERLGAASDAFDARQREYETAFEKRQAQAEAEAAKRLAKADEAIMKHLAEQSDAFAKQQAAESETVARALADLERVRKETAEECARQLADYQQAFEARQKEYVEFFKREIDQLEKRAEKSEARLKNVVAALQS